MPPTPPKLVPKPKTAAQRRERIGKILEGLDQLYPNVTCALHHRTAWELLVATILTLLVVPALYALWFRVSKEEAAAVDRKTSPVEAGNSSKARIAA